MSTFKPDIFNRLKEKGFVYETIESADSLMAAQREEAITPVTYTPVESLVGAIQTHCQRFKGDAKEIYEYAKISTLTTNEIYASQHYFNILITYFMSTLKKTYPGVEFIELEAHLQNAGRELNRKVRTEAHIDNTLMLPAMLGMVETLI
jgi:hypothetical protein